MKMDFNTQHTGLCQTFTRAIYLCVCILFKIFTFSSDSSPTFLFSHKQEIHKVDYDFDL